MVDGGELAAAFRVLAGDAAQAGEDIGNSMGRWFEHSAGIEEENVNRTFAYAGNARALDAIGPDPVNLTETPKLHIPALLWENADSRGERL